MNKLLLAFCLTIISSAFVFGQSDDYKKTEFSVGYTNQQVDTGANTNSGNAARDFFNDRLSYNGFEVSGVYNVHRYVGIKADFSGAYRNREYNYTTGTGTTTTNVNFENRNSLYNALGGVQFKDNKSDSRLKPFGHVLVGVGVARTKVKNLACSNAVVTNCANFAASFTDKGIAGAVGGGLDIKLTDKVDFRAVQVDYNPIRLNDQTNHNFRFGIGFVFH